MINVAKDCLTEEFEKLALNGFKPLRCKGYSKKYNAQKDYRTAKEPITKGFTASDYKGPTIDECLKWIKQGGWVGWIIPEGVIALDIEDKATFNYMINYCKQLGINPGTHESRNGSHTLFKGNGIKGDSKAYVRAGFKITYRAGGKNYFILSPMDGRKWLKWTDIVDLPEIPEDFRPYNYKDRSDLLNILSWLLADAYSDAILSGYDLDTSYMAFLIENGFINEEIHHSFELIFRDVYNYRRTEDVYARAKTKIHNGDPLRGSGSFINSIKKAGLAEIENFTRQISAFNKSGKQLEWHDPIPFDNYTNLPEFPTEALPEYAKDMIEAVSQCHQVDPGLPGTIYIGVLATCLQGKAEVDLITHRETLSIYQQ